MGWVVGLARLASLLGCLVWFRWLGYPVGGIGKVGTFWFRYYIYTISYTYYYMNICIYVYEILYYISFHVVDSSIV